MTTGSATLYIGATPSKHTSKEESKRTRKNRATTKASNQATEQPYDQTCKRPSERRASKHPYHHNRNQSKPCHTFQSFAEGSSIPTNRPPGMWRVSICACATPPAASAPPTTRPTQCRHNYKWSTVAIVKNNDWINDWMIACWV